MRWIEQVAARDEEEKGRYAEQLTAARAKLKKANDEVRAVRAELTAQQAMTSEAEEAAEKARADLRRLGAELKTANDSQGEVLRAYMRRLLLSQHFSELANELAELINGNTALFALEEAAKVVPDLDVSKFGYERLEGAALLSRYAEVIRDHLGRIPILNELASSKELLTAEQVTTCSIDRDPVLEAAFDVLPDAVKGDDPEQEREKGDVIVGDEDPNPSKSSEGPETAEAGEIGEGPSAGQQLTSEKEVGKP